MVDNKLFFNDRVKLTNGFYEGRSGTLKGVDVVYVPNYVYTSLGTYENGTMKEHEYAVLLDDGTTVKARFKELEKVE